MKLAPPAGRKWTPADLLIGDPFLFKPKEKSYTLGGTLLARLPMFTRTLLAIEPVVPTGLTKEDCKSTFYEDEIVIVERFSSLEDLKKYKELVRF